MIFLLILIKLLYVSSISDKVLIPVEIIIGSLNFAISFRVGISVISPEPILKAFTSIFNNSKAAFNENGVHKY